MRYSTVTPPAHYRKKRRDLLFYTVYCMRGDKMIQRLDRLKLYNKGLSDEELAKEDNVLVESIVQWRYRNGLPSNTERDLSIPIEHECIDNRIELYVKGYTYTEIAQAIGLTKSGVAGWFRLRGFKPNKKYVDSRIELYNQGKTDKQIAKRIGVSSSAIGQWRRIRGLTPNKNTK